MTKIVLNDLVNLENQTSVVNTINANNAVIETAFDNTLSRDGTSPNQMNASLDMNSHRILNIPSPIFSTDLIRLEDLQDATIIGAQGPQGTQGIVGPQGPPGLTGPQGPNGTGTGDMIAANNLSDLVNKANSRKNIGLERVISLKDFGVIGNGLTDDTAAIQAAINASPSTGALIVFPAGRYRVSSALTINKPITLRGEGIDASIITTASTTGDIITSTGGDVVIEDIGIDSLVTRASGAIHINVPSSVLGGGVNSIRLNRVYLLNCATGVKISASFGWIQNCRIDIVPVFGTGVITTSNAGIYVDSTFIFGIGLPWLGTQPYVGLQLSDCGNAVVSNTQMLCTGVGVDMSPSTGGQICTSLFFSNVLCDHCTTAWRIAPANSQSANTITLNQCWGAAAVNTGLLISPDPTSFVQYVNLIGFISQSNGNSGAGRIAVNGLQIEGNVTNLSIAGGVAYDHPLAADISIFGNVNQMSISGMQLGYSGFPSFYGISLGGSCSKITVANCLFADVYTTAKVLNSSSGSQIKFVANPGYVTDASSSISLTPNGAGLVVVPHGMSVTPTTWFGEVQGTGFIQAQPTNADGTNITFTLLDAAGAPIVSGSRTVLWNARL